MTDIVVYRMDDFLTTGKMVDPVNYVGIDIKVTNSGMSISSCRRVDKLLHWRSSGRQITNV